LTRSGFWDAMATPDCPYNLIGVGSIPTGSVPKISAKRNNNENSTIQLDDELDYFPSPSRHV